MAALETGEDLFEHHWQVPWHAHILPALLAVAMLGYFFSQPIDRMQAWALSWPGIYQHGLPVLIVHMLVHGGIVHVLMNVLGLLFVSGPVISRLGQPPLACARFIYLFIGSGLAGGLLFLLLHMGSAKSMLGCSGAVFGILGALARIHPRNGTAVAIRSARTWTVVKLFVQNHAFLVAILLGLAFLTNHPVGLAWEAHLGGLLFGFFAAPLFLPVETNDH